MLLKEKNDFKFFEINLIKVKKSYNGFFLGIFDSGLDFYFCGI